MLSFIPFLLFCLGLQQKAVVNYLPQESYRCAIYNLPMDFSYMAHMRPGKPTKITAHTYIIEYGDNIVYQISDAGDFVTNSPVMIGKFDYDQGMMHLAFYMREAKKYLAETDTINFSIDERRSIISPEVKEIAKGDSLLLTSVQSGKSHMLFFEERIPNIRAQDLFYPDVPYLPSKIVPSSKRQSTWYLEEVLYGKESMDSILTVYQFLDFEEITEEEKIRAEMMFPIEEVKKLIPPEED